MVIHHCHHAVSHAPSQGNASFVVGHGPCCVVMSHCACKKPDIVMAYRPCTIHSAYQCLVIALQRAGARSIYVLPYGDACMHHQDERDPVHTDTNGPEQIQVKACTSTSRAEDGADHSQILSVWKKGACHKQSKQSKALPNDPATNSVTTSKH